MNYTPRPVTARPGRARTADIIFLVVLVTSVAAIMLLRAGPSDEAVAHGSSVFAGTPTFAAAKQRAEAENKPIFVLASATWCPPCQQFKGTTLADDDVIASIDAAAVPYLLDVTDAAALSAEDQRLAQRLGVQGIPAAYIVQPDGTATAKAVGHQPKERFLDWLASSTN